MTTFNPNIPQPANLLSNSQGQLLSNNAALDASFAVDHTLFSATANNGMHNKVTIFQSLTSVPTLTSPSSLIYSLTTGTGATAITNLFYSCLQNNVQQYIQLTGQQSITSRGYATLTGGLIIQWGTDTAVSNVVTVNFPLTFPHAAFVALATPQDNSTSRGIADGSLITTGFIAQTENSTTTIYWIALGN